MAISYKSNKYIVRYQKDGKTKVISYSVNIYGKYAKKLAELSEITHIRYNNFIIKKDNYAIIKNYSKKFGYNNILIDLDDIDRIDICKWTINKRPNGVLVVRGKIKINSKIKSIFLHRYILNVYKDEANDRNFIDHINRNPLDNRKSNLRFASNSINQKNKSIQKNNTSGIVGVSYNSNIGSWVCRWNDFNKKRHTRTFSVNKYGNDNAKKMAISLRRKMEEKYGYITNK